MVFKLNGQEYVIPAPGHVIPAEAGIQEGRG